MLWDQYRRTANPMHPERKQRLADVVERKQAAPGPAPLTGFRIGARASGVVPGQAPGPAIGNAPVGPPLRMDAKRFGHLKRGKLAPEARLDLHGMTQAQAHPELIAFILSAQLAGHRLVLVITGKGRGADDDGPIPARRGVLRHQVPHWLSLPPLRQVVLQTTEAHLKHGGSGALYVYLRR